MAKSRGVSTPSSTTLPGRWRFSRRSDKRLARESWLPDQPTALLRAILITGGEGGIRTHETVARLRHFQCRALDRTRRPLRGPIERSLPAASRLPREPRHPHRRRASGLHLGPVLCPAGMEVALPIQSPVGVCAEIVPQPLHEIRRPTLAAIAVVVRQR